MHSEPVKTVFADPRGGRRRFLQFAIVFSILLVGAGVAYFIWGLLIGPQLRLPAIVRDYRAHLRSIPAGKIPARDSRDDWRRIHEDTRKESKATSQNQARKVGVVLGYVSPWDPASLLSLEHHAGQLTHVAADWFSLTGVEGTLQEDPNDAVRLHCLHYGIGFLPILRNLEGDTWQPEAVEALAAAPVNERQQFIKKLISRLPPGSRGLLVEWSELDPTYKKEISELVCEIAQGLHADGRELWFSVPTGNDFDVFDLEKIAEASDRMVAALYDENSEPADPGPLASSDWFQGWLKTMMVYGEPDQWVIGLGCYSYDWRKDTVSVEPIGFTDTMARAAAAGVNAVDVVSEDDSPHFSYLGGLNQDQEHEVWFLDAVTFANQLREIAPYHPGGVGLYRLGEEDPTVWDLLKKDLSHPLDSKELEELAKLNLDEQIASTGSGDFISVGEDARQGERSVTQQPSGELLDRYTRFPMPENIIRQGDPGKHMVAITFDDGPDPKWTPKILEILKQKKAPATFFVLGSQVQQYPDLLERIAREGHEIGNHSYTHQNLAEAGDEEIELELNATTRLIEAVTGHSTAYFRPPYNSDGTPTQPGEVRALRVARDLGYLTVGQSIDPDDWERPGVEALIQRVKKQRGEGSVILLHDAGGDRSQTVAALPSIIDYLRERGDVIVPLSEIIRLPRDTVMPPLREQDQPLSTRYVYGGFAVMRFLEDAAWTLLAVATLLALLRVVFYSCCAIRHRALGESISTSAAQIPPAASVLLAAFNEARVIESTLRHLIASDYPSPLEIIVVDDGSIDRTAAIVEGLAATEKRIKLIRQANAGKAAALNRAFCEATHNVLIMIDADTMIVPDAIRRLVAPLADPKVGGVSGYIRVGNTKGWMGKFQDLEYVSAFEIDRRAQDLLGCIVVAPGALSAFRREAFQEAGMLAHDTLAEDTDLTLQLHRLGWKVVFAPLAFADTEAPENIKALLSQRFRWSFGTLQCLWKHGAVTFGAGTGWLGWLALPSVWVFQIAIVAITPILDIMVIWSLWWGRGVAIWPYFLASLLLDVGLACVALILARRHIRNAWLAIPMRLLYRPMLGYVVWKCILKALGGSWVRWAKLERTAAAIEQRQKTGFGTTGDS